MHCDKCYGSEAAAIMHMRQKHEEGTKQEIERKRGIRVHEELLKKENSEEKDEDKNVVSQLGQRGQISVPPISNPSELQAKLLLPSKFSLFEPVGGAEANLALLGRKP